MTKRYVYFYKGVKVFEMDYYDIGYLKAVKTLSVYDTISKKYVFGGDDK